MFDPLIPDRWAASLNQVSPGITGALVDGGGDWIGAMERILPAIIATDAQRRILGVQLERARAGLPPLDVSGYGAAVQVGLDPATRNMLLIGGAALAAFLLLRRSR